MHHVRIAIIPIALLVLAGSGLTAQEAQPDPGRVPETGSDPLPCGECHTGVDAGKREALAHGDAGTCLACHHIGFTNDPTVAAARRTEACESCHNDIRRSHFDAAPEDRPTCGSCHAIHGEPAIGEAQRALSARCARCHTAPHLLHAVAGARAPECTQCHLAHAPAAANPDRVMSRQCGSCHEGSHASHRGVIGGLTCIACHSAMKPLVAGTTDGRSDACVECHYDVLPAHSGAGTEAPSCLQCHTFAGSEPLAEPDRTMSAMCAGCHAEEWEGMLAGGHREGLGDAANPDLPTCVTCHRGHNDPAEEPGYARLAATIRCIDCHSREDLIEAYGLPAGVAASYADDYHGATVRFLWNHPPGAGQPAVMICADCHGAHEVGWKDDAVLSSVCAGCHDADDERLASAWLGHDPVGPRNAVLVWLVRAFYYGLIPFMLAGLFLNIVFDLGRDHLNGVRMMKSVGVKRIKARLRGERAPAQETITRFSVHERLEHLCAMVTFVLLVITGIPQTRPDLGITNWIVGVFGGIGGTRFVHRVLGFLFVALLVAHVGRAIVRAIRYRRLPIMIADRKDFEDGLQIVRHYRFGEPGPRAGKFDLAAKFEYWGLFLGGVLMTVTGLVLVFPELVTRFVPGLVVAAMRTMHGLEATFAVLVVVLWHSWGVIFRPEVFPLDTSIFTGKITVERLRQEHPLEYERLFPERVAAAEMPGFDGPGTIVLRRPGEQAAVE